jgi:uncharacterized C2H2 Zn-finger protein
MKEEKKNVGARHGKSYAKCLKCGVQFKLRKNTKHSSRKVIKAVCPKCSGVKK